MNDKVFIDTNIFVYMQSPKDKEKCELSGRAIENFYCVTSTQVLSELSNVFTKKFKISAEHVKKFVDAVVLTCEVKLIHADLIKQALDLREHYRYSYYDCLIISAALDANCNYLLSEDLSDGQIIENRMKIINIYAHPEFLL